MKFLTMTILAMSLLNAPAFAKDHCNCDKACHARCAAGKTEDCNCKACDCKSGKGCKHGKCGLPKKDEAKTE